MAKSKVVRLDSSGASARKLERKLTTVFYGDIVGYSRLTGKDEVATHHAVMKALDVARDEIVSNGGTVLRYAGDAILAEFSSVVAAVDTAMAIQTKPLSSRKMSPIPARCFCA